MCNIATKLVIVAFKAVRIKLWLAATLRDFELFHEDYSCETFTENMQI